MGVESERERIGIGTVCGLVWEKREISFENSFIELISYVREYGSKTYYVFLKLILYRSEWAQLENISWLK